MRQQRCPTHNISLIDGVCLQCKKLEEGYNKNFRNPDIDIPAEAYDAAEQLDNNKIEGEKEDQDNQPLIMVEALNCYNELKSFDFSPARIVEEMISRFHITRINP